eukprot:CAMPEP_0202450986 /NCGR_PEP_ID=MMETSP1360-20130828/9514_1 /ASSEMBLY_ACC=CAM_ASM_000848 /TAXON_ID=515479 /ORGANISM="Licmophora paradoxa, Strain CCMP2313" /LENGTH=656 /DNA_ID=CAMNT_0049069447 /DNA_START=93 /DNA_END=2063 /DNA_ORIENTATION=+
MTSTTTTITSDLTETTWNLGGPQFRSAREVYTRNLLRLCLKFTTSEDEDEGKPEPATAFWTSFSSLTTTIGSGPARSSKSDHICRPMDDTMTGPTAGILTKFTDADGDLAAKWAQQSGFTAGWYLKGDRGDAAVRVGNAKIINTANQQQQQLRHAQLLSLDTNRWVLRKGASFAAGNSVFQVEDDSSTNNNNNKQQQRRLIIQCSKGPMRGKTIEIPASKCPFVFGRAHEADLCIMDRELSRRHGAIIFVPTNHVNGKQQQQQNGGVLNHKPAGIFILTDLQSTNGSYMRLIGPYSQNGVGALAIGDEFIVGRTGFSVNRFDFGISEAIGARPTMEDRTLVLQSLVYDIKDGSQFLNEPKDQLEELSMISFAAVFDGHGGNECSNYLVDALPHQLRLHLLGQRERIITAIKQSRNNNGNNNTDQPTNEDPVSELMRKIIKAAYLKTDKDFITPKTAPQSGSTAATVILMGRRLFAPNVGDSRVVLCRGGGQCVELTSDHKPSRPDEAARVRAAGGFILHKRVMGELAITRAFGDKSFKMGIKAMLEDDAEDFTKTTGANGREQQTKDLTAPLVSAEPEIASMIVSHNDEFLLLACDGLFDVFRSQDAIALARQELIAHRGEPAEVARILSDQAIRVRRSRDNVSILIIVLRPFWEQ